MSTPKTKASNHQENPAKKKYSKIEERERKIDRQLEQTFPASDPPSFAQPGNVMMEEE